MHKPAYIKLDMAKYDYIMEQLHLNRVLNAHMRAKITQLNREKLSLANVLNQQNQNVEKLSEENSSLKMDILKLNDICRNQQDGLKKFNEYLSQTL